MSCILDEGVEFACDDSSGGIKQASFLIAQFDTVDSWTPTNGEITALSMVGSGSFYRFNMKSDVANFLSTETHTPENGQSFFETVIAGVLPKLSKEKNVLMKVLTGKPVVIIVQDLNDVYHIFGLERGAEKMGTNTSGSGTLMGDLNGYTLGFTDRSKNLYTVATSVMATLPINGVS